MNRCKISNHVILSICYIVPCLHRCKKESTETQNWLSFSLIASECNVLVFMIVDDKEMLLHGI